MDYQSGNIFIRAPVLPMKLGEQTDNHKHNFDHTLYVKSGEVEVQLLDVHSFDSHDQPMDYTVRLSKVINAQDEVNWFLVMKGYYHRIISRQDGTMYHCIFSHRAPQAISLHSPGAQQQAPYVVHDEDGTMWVKVDPTVLQDTVGWVEAYR